MKKAWKKYKEKLNQHFQEVLKEHHSPRSIAISFAIGTFVSILPTPGLNIVICALIALTYEKINKLSLFLSLAVWNPIVLAGMYALSYGIGDKIFGAAPIVQYDIAFLDKVYNFTRRFLVGNFILAVSTSLLSYFIIKKIVIWRRKNNKQ